MGGCQTSIAFFKRTPFSTHSHFVIKLEVLHEKRRIQMGSFYNFIYSRYGTVCNVIGETFSLIDNYSHLANGQRIARSLAHVIGRSVGHLIGRCVARVIGRSAGLWLWLGLRRVGMSSSWYRVSLHYFALQRNPWSSPRCLSQALPPFPPSPPFSCEQVHMRDIECCC